jgi:redox-sensitive bicupin YhaK (pirin superfamily)
VQEPRIDVRRAGDRFRTDPGWANTFHSFSFGDHYDPANVGFGALVAHNDETVRSGSGYADHPHRDTEIVTWVLSGSLVHADSAGNRGVVHPGLAQRLSAGSGVVHAERNDAYLVEADAAPEPVHFVQMWLRPDAPGTPPSYAARPLDLADLGRGWLPVASGAHPDAAVDLGSTGSTLWATRLGPGTVRTLPDAARLHVFVARGVVEVESVGALGPGDALRLTGSAPLRLTGTADEAELLVWELAA